MRRVNDERDRYSDERSDRDHGGRWVNKDKHDQGDYQRIDSEYGTTHHSRERKDGDGQQIRKCSSECAGYGGQHRRKQTGSRSGNYSGSSSRSPSRSPSHCHGRNRSRNRGRAKEHGRGTPSRKRKWRSDSPTSTADSLGKLRARRGREAHSSGTHGECDNNRSVEDGEEEAEVLPVTLFKDDLMRVIRSSQVLVCTGETGSGKTTQIPQYLLELVLEGDIVGDGDEKGKVDTTDAKEKQARESGTRKLQVAVTQPRRVAATSVARRVAQERGCQVGEEVGYSIRFEDYTGPQTRIKYMTDGVLVRECLEDPCLRRYGVVVLDEAHERSVDTDVLFGLLKRALARRSDLRAVITSATLDVERFAAFFGNCPYINIPGRTHPVDIYHSKTRQVMTANGPASPRYVEDAVEIILKVHRTQGPGHILTFFTGQDEIERACRLVREVIATEKATREADGGVGVPGNQDGTEEQPLELLVVPLFGALSAEAQAKAFRPAHKGVRKVVMATNIAETSVTVPGVRFVIDPGYVKQKTYDPARRMESLIVVPISQVAAQQRAGRAGRTAPGQCYRLYSRDCYGAMLSETVPEILRTNVANTLLYLKVLGIDDVLSFDFLDPPAEDQALEALQHLYCLGALDRDGCATATGRRMSRFPLDPSLSRTLLEAGELGCLEEVLTIVALLSVESIWFSRNSGGESQPGGRGVKGVGSGGSRGRKVRSDKDEEAEASHAIYRHPLGDHFTYLAVYRAWKASGYSDDWAKKSFLRIRALRTARNVRAQLLGEVRKADRRAKGGLSKDLGQDGTRVASCGKEIDKIRKAVCAGYFMNAGQRCSKEWVYRSLAVETLQREGLSTGQSGLNLMFLHPSSALLYAQEPPEHVVYTELVFTARPFMRHAMAVKGRWLRSRLESVQPCTADGLCGRALNRETAVGEVPTADNVVTSASGSAEGGTVESEANEQRVSARKTDAIAAARARFLARKSGTK